jgi:hypothetical protein
VPAGRGDLERATAALLPADFVEVEKGPRRCPIRRLCRHQVVLAAKVSDRLGQVPDRNGLDAGQSRFRRVLLGAEDPPEPGVVSALGNRDRPGDRANEAIEAELPKGGVLGQALRRDLPRGGEDCERDGEVETRPLLAKRGRSEVDGDSPFLRPLEQRRRDPGADPVLRLLAGAVGKADDRERGHAPRNERLHDDTARLEADEGVGDRTCEHTATLGVNSSRFCAGQAPRTRRALPGSKPETL